MTGAVMKTLVIGHHLRAEKHRYHAEDGMKIGSACLARPEELAETVERELVSPEIAGAELDAVDPLVHHPVAQVHDLGDVGLTYSHDFSPDSSVRIT